MLDFLWTVRGSIPLNPNVSYAATLDRVVTLLERQRKQPARRGHDLVTFDMPFWERKQGWQALLIFNHGRFWTEHGLDGRVLHYRLNCLHLFAACVMFAVGLAALTLVAGSAQGDVAYNGAWLFALFYAVNYLVAWVRAGRVIRDAVGRR